MSIISRIYFVKVHLLNSDLNIKEGNESDLNICIKPTHDRFYQQKQNTKHSNTQEELKRNCPLTPHRFRFTMMVVMMMMTMMVVMMMTMMIMLHSSNVTVRLTPHRLANFNSPASATHWPLNKLVPVYMLHVYNTLHI